MFFSPPLTLPLGHVILSQQFLSLSTLFTHTASPKAFSKFYGKNWFPPSQWLSLKLFHCSLLHSSPHVRSTEQQRFLTAHYAEGQVQALLWIPTKVCTQLGETEMGTTSPEPGNPMRLELILLLTAACPSVLGQCRPAGPLIFQTTSQPALPNHHTSHSTSLLKGSVALPWINPSSRLSSMAWLCQRILWTPQSMQALCTLFSV